jgi:hypothetical protein
MTDTGQRHRASEQALHASPRHTAFLAAAEHRATPGVFSAMRCDPLDRSLEITGEEQRPCSNLLGLATNQTRRVQFVPFICDCFRHRSAQCLLI